MPPAETGPAGRVWPRWVRWSLGMMILLGLAFGAYTVKSDLGIDLFRGVSFSKVLHLQAWLAEIHHLGPKAQP